MIDPPRATDDILAAADTALAALIDVRTAHLHATNELERAQEANQATVELVSLFAKMPF